MKLLERMTMTAQMSVCIPIFNRDVRSFVNGLCVEIERFQLSVDICLIDDGSLESYRLMNREIDSSLVFYEELKENIGRARIRNLFLKKTNSPILLYVDCDSDVYKEDFLRTYLFCFDDPSCKIIYGGRKYPENYRIDQKLEWLYGTRRIDRCAAVRSKEGNHAFLSNNFAARREVILQVPFDESISRYGYEDMLFQFQLSLHGVEVYHVDNPVLNTELDTNEQVLDKMEQATITLGEILSTSSGTRMRKNMKLLKYFDRLNQALPYVVPSVIARFFFPVVRFFLLRYPNLLWMDLYKLVLLYHNKIATPNK